MLKLPSKPKLYVCCRSIPVPARKDSVKVEAFGIFPGAMVIRSVEDFVLSDQDGKCLRILILVPLHYNLFVCSHFIGLRHLCHLMYIFSMTAERFETPPAPRIMIILNYFFLQLNTFVLRILTFFLFAGGEGTLGTVLQDDPEETSRCSGMVSIIWDSDITGEHRCGKDGKVDVRCFIPASGEFYYRDHLARLSDKLVCKRVESLSVDEEDEQAPQIYNTISEHRDLQRESECNFEF